MKLIATWTQATINALLVARDGALLIAAGSATRQRLPGADPSSNVISEGATLALVMPAWEIDLWGKLAARTEAARRDVLANAALAQGVRTSLAAQVATLYLDLLDLDQQLAIALGDDDQAV